MFRSKNFRKIIFALIILLTFPISSINGQNVALGKSYTLSVSPNYPYTAPSSDKTSLTDGVYTKSYFWAAKTTVGWQHVPVTITIDLGEQQPIEAVTFNTVRREDQYVNFPKNIFVFISNDNENFQYVGDVADDSANIPGPYLVKKFELSAINKIARFVRLSVIPNGPFLFCDEIEVLKGDATAFENPQLIPKQRLADAEDSLKNLEFLKKNLLKSLNRFESSKKNTKTSVELYKNIRKQLRQNNININDLNKLQQQLAIENLLQSAGSIKASYMVQAYNPWDTLNRFYIPTSDYAPLQYDYYLPENGVQYGSFLLINTSKEKKSFKFKINNISSFTALELFAVPFVPSINYQEVADPLLPIKGSISLLPGNTEMIIFKLLGLKEGVSRIDITINSGGKTVNAHINADVFKIRVDNKIDTLNANVWAYFTQPMISDRKEQAAADLYEHHINTIVIPPAILPMIQTTDYSRFSDYLSNFKEVKKFLLFMNYGSLAYRNGYPTGKFLSSEWKAKFIDWYNKITTSIKQNGFPNSQIYLYPYDEIYGKDIDDFKDLIVWAKAAIPKIKFYATLANDEAVNTILPLVDVAQIQLTYKGLTNLPSHKCEIWIYSGSAPSRALSPYSFYRLMAWEAFANGYEGIGFWNYADEGINKNLNKITDALIYPSNSYSAIYDGPGKEIISSRRWEAFRLGIEDYSILQAYTEKFGFNKTRALADEVLAIPADVNKADAVRNLMIKSILGIE